MDQLTNEFFNNHFPKFKNTAVVSENLLSTNVPVVEVNLGIDTSLLLDLVKNINLDQVIRPTYPYESDPRISGWSMQTLWSDGTVVPWLSDIYYKKYGDPIDKKEPDTASLPIKEIFEELELTAKVCWLSKFQPGGYLRPHRDISLNPTPLDYFWLPLNNPVGSELKIYPYGTVDINLGSLYLLNQENYVHSVVNQSNEDRYVLLGHLNQPLASSIADKVQQSIHDFFNKY